MNTVLNIALFLLGIVLFGAAFYFFDTDKPAGGGAMLLAGGSCVFLSKMGEIIEFRLGKWHARAETMLSKAEVTIEAVQEMGIGLAAMSLQLLKAESGTFCGNSGLSRLEKEKLFEETIEVLTRLNVPQSKVTALAEEVWCPDIDNKYRQTIMGIPRAQDEQKWAGYTKELHALEFTSLEPEILEEIAKKHDVLTPELRLAIDDFTYYRKNRRHRDKERYGLGTPGYATKRST